MVYLFVEDEKQLVAQGLTPAGSEIMGVDVVWSTKNNVVSVDDTGLVTANIKGSTEVYATNPVRDIRGTLKIMVQKPIKTVVVYEGDGTDMQVADNSEPGDPASFDPVIKGTKLRVYALAYDDESDMLHDISFTWDSNDTDKATVKAVKAVGATKMPKDNSEAKTNPGNFKALVTTKGTGSANITAIANDDIESEAVKVTAFAAVATVRMLEVDQADLPVMYTYGDNNSEASGQVSVQYFRTVISTASGTEGDMVREGVIGTVTFSEVGGSSLITFSADGEGMTTGDASDLGPTDGNITLQLGGGDAPGTIPDNTVYGKVGSVTEKTVVYVQASAPFAGSQVIEVTINPAE